MANQQDLLMAVTCLENAAKRHDVDEIMALFTDDAEFDLVGLTRLVGKAEIRTIFDYDAGVSGEIKLINCEAKEDTISCQMVEHNDRIAVAGLDQLLYPSCVLSFRNKLIRSWRAVPDEEGGQAFDRFWEPVRLWIAEHYPADYAQLYTHEGRFIRNRNNGERAVQLAREYRSTVVG